MNGIVMIGIGVVVLLYGLITEFLGRSILFGGNLKKYTEKSVKLYARLSGVAEVILGGAFCIINLAKGDIIRLFCAVFIWLSLATLLTLYFSVLKKK